MEEETPAYHEAVITKSLATSSHGIHTRTMVRNSELSVAIKASDHFLLLLQNLAVVRDSDLSVAKP